jgi:hypothetical protein
MSYTDPSIPYTKQTAGVEEVENEGGIVWRNQKPQWG